MIISMKDGIRVPRIEYAVTEAEQIHAALETANVEWLPIACHNWAEQYPYSPEVRCRMAHTGMSLLIEYDVCEDAYRAEAESDNGNVWQDSCCELFLQPQPDGDYYNIECNCGGTMLIGVGSGRHDRVRATDEQLRPVGRWSSLGRGVHPLHVGDSHWQLALLLPVEALFRHSMTSLDGLAARCNIYKCGDMLPKPHFMSLSKVETPNPDFHRPDFFVPCTFE